MAHDVWLLRGAVVACLLLSTFTGAESIPIKDDISEVGHKVNHEINFTRKESTAARMQIGLWNKRLTGSYGRHQTKRGVTKGTAETGASKSRMQILEKYYVNPEIVKKGAIDENVSEGDKETYQSALLLEEPNLETERNHFENGELSEEPLNVEKYGAHSVEGTKIANAASLLANSVESHGVKVAESVINKYPRQNISKLPVAFQYDSPAQNGKVYTRGKFMQRSRFRYVNSLIKPQLAGISDDVNDLEALRNHAKELNVGAPNNGLKSPERKLDGQLWEESTAIGENANKHAEKPSSTKKDLSEYNTEIISDAGYNPEDMFLLGTPDDTRYFQNVFMENPGAVDLFTGSAQEEPVHSEVGSVVQPTPPWQRSGATVPLKQEDMLGKLLGESESSESGLLPSGDESDLNEGSDDPNMNLQAALTLATQADMSIKNSTSRVLLQPFGDKAMSHIEEESNDMYNEQNNDPDTLYSTGNGSLEIKKVNPFLHFSPTKKRDFPKTTTLTSYRRTTIPHGTFSPLLFESPSHASGGESGSGEYYVSAREHHQKEKPVHSKTNVSLPSKEKNNAGIIGAQDEATITKCKKMGKADYRKKCPPGWLPFDEFCYLFVSKSNGRWEEFPQRCNEENGVLAMPKTDKELEFLQDKILSSKHRSKRFYIGLKKKNGIWTWVDDVPYIRDVHVKDELGNKNCAALFKGDIRMVTCSKPKAGYICETRTGAQVLPILAFGDSLTTGYHCDDSSHTPYGNTLEYLLNKDIHRCYTVTTEGKEGTEAGQMFTRLQNHLKYAKSKYSWVIILAGTNDIAHNSHTRNRKSWDTAVEHIINLHITSHRYGAKTVAVTIPEMDCEESKRPPCLHTHLERKYINEKLRYYARSNEFTVLCDLAVEFPRYSLSSDERKLMWEVGLHMKPAGYERMAEIIYKDMLAHF